MATRIKPTAKDLYEEDFYVWAQNQAALLARRDASTSWISRI